MERQILRYPELDITALLRNRHLVDEERPCRHGANFEFTWPDEKVEGVEASREIAGGIKPDILTPIDDSRLFFIVECRDAEAVPHVLVERVVELVT